MLRHTPRPRFLALYEWARRAMARRSGQADPPDERELRETRQRQRAFRRGILQRGQSPLPGRAPVGLRLHAAAAAAGRGE